MTCHRAIGDGCIWEGISLMSGWILALSNQLVIHQVLECQWWCV